MPHRMILSVSRHKKKHVKYTANKDKTAVVFCLERLCCYYIAHSFFLYSETNRVFVMNVCQTEFYNL